MIVLSINELSSSFIVLDSFWTVNANNYSGITVTKIRSEGGLMTAGSKLHSGRLVLLCLVLFGISGLSAQFSGGSGTPEDPYLIANLQDLVDINNYLDAHFRQVADINLNVAPYNTAPGWTPIGTWIYYNEPANAPFTGSYSGNGFIIDSLFISSGNVATKGLFGFTQNAQLSDVDLRNVNVTCNFRGAGLVSYCNNTTISRCTVTGSVSGDGNSLGLLAAVAEQTSFIQCFVDGTLNGEADMVGGLVGFNKYPGTTSWCTVAGSITGDENVGGLFGYNMSDVLATASSSTANVTGRNYCGGIVGVTYSNCSYNDCYATGNVSGTSYIGGIVGTSQTSQFTNCYSTGSVSGTGFAGGMAGAQAQSIATHCYWNIETSGQGTSALGSGRNTDDMTYPFDAMTYEEWDFDIVWAYDETGVINSGYPYLHNLATGYDATTVTPHVSTFLSSNPNPFSSSVQISFNLDKSEAVTMRIYNLKGQKIRTLTDGFLIKGKHGFYWDGKSDTGNSVAAGIYLCRLSGNGFQTVRKLSLVK
jgi:hypothetical protein